MTEGRQRTRGTSYYSTFASLENREHIRLLAGCWSVRRPGILCWLLHYSDGLYACSEYRRLPLLVLDRALRCRIQDVEMLKLYGAGAEALNASDLNLCPIDTYWSVSADCNTIGSPRATRYALTFVQAALIR